MTYANWKFGITDIFEVAVTAHIENDPGAQSDLYLQLYDAPIDGTPMYHGLQTTNLAIFSRFGTVDVGEVRAAAGAHVVSGTDEGPYVSLRMPFAVSAGTYRTRLQRGAHEGEGDWFEFSVARFIAGEPDQQGAWIEVGAIWFPRSRSQVPASLADGGGSWVEFWDNNGPVLHPVPFWRVRLEPPIANRTVRARGASLRCSRMPNGRIEWDPQREQVVSSIGGDTWRQGNRVDQVRWE